MYQTNYVLNNANPEAFITRKKSRAKIYQFNNYYFNNGETFEIELFNPKSNRVLTKIWINGKEISGSGIVLNPGQRIFLERFIDSNNSFIYQTYEVENTTESLEAIRRNGDIEVKFYDEYYTNNYWYGYGTTTTSNIVGSLSTTTSNIETGRIEKGGATNQSFETTYGTFIYYPCKEFKYKILPISVKPIEGKDLKKYCTNCGKALKKEWKYCSNCGHKC